ncbi:MAG TPA: hypothetical protein VJX94_18910 [Stellaceae bacterium]|nr:hypothetical protein [Stellaceae bacterium]
MGTWTAKPSPPAPRRGTALLAVFAILLQAVLFAWHHHPLPLSSQGVPIVLAAPATGHTAPVLADDDCPICFALSHHSAAPVDFPAAPPPPPDHASLSPATVEAILAPVASYFLFRSRAPPRA